MAKTVKMRLVRGNHRKVNADGDREDCKVGEVVELTPEQAEAFGDKFEPADRQEREREARMQADADADAEAEAAEAKAKEEAEAKAKAEAAAKQQGGQK